MKTGNFTREYTKNTTKWVVEGFSNQSNRYVYPHEGWSWTEWRSEITDTYDTMEKARQAISYGYLKDMIEHQKIVDIRIYEIIKTSKVVEDKTVNCYNTDGTPVEHIEPVYTTDVGALGAGDYLIIGTGVGASCYARVTSVHNNRMILEIINGGWTLILDASTNPPTVHADSPRMAEHVGEQVTFAHIGIPDPTDGRDDYDYQIMFYQENFEGKGEMTSTLALG